MRVVKRLLCPERVRRVPDPFSWVDPRLVRYKHIRGCSPEALALYLPLVAVGDAQGLGYDGDATVAGLLSMSSEAVARARRKLLDAAQIAAELDPDPDTVTRWLNEPKSRPRNPSMRARKLDPFKPLILKMLERYPYSAAQILGRLREDGTKVAI